MKKIYEDIWGAEQKQGADSQQSQTIIFCASHLNQSAILSKPRVRIHELLQVLIHVVQDKIDALLVVDNIICILHVEE
jgi:hypothetical protein